MGCLKGKHQAAWTCPGLVTFLPLILAAGLIHGQMLENEGVNEVQRNAISPEAQKYFPPGSANATEADFEKEVKNMLYTALRSVTNQVTAQYGFCIQDIDDGKNTFDYSEDSSFISDCDEQTGNTLLSRLCGEAETKFYFENIMDPTKLPSNENCNTDIWPQGCEPGWAASTSLTDTSLLNDTKTIPNRSENPQTCCPGFFCPRGLTCMMPCPLGAYCPLATESNYSGRCEPYNYYVKSGKGEICGGADVWAADSSEGGIFCEAGSYCPSPVDKLECTAGLFHTCQKSFSFYERDCVKRTNVSISRFRLIVVCRHYCRRGSTSQKRCTFLTACKGQGQQIQNLQVTGILLIVIIAVWLLLIYSCSDQLLLIRERRKTKARDTAARQAREHVTAMERWRKAKVAARRQATNFSGQLTRTVTRKKMKPPVEEMSIFTPKAAPTVSHSSLLSMTIAEDESLSSDPQNSTFMIVTPAHQGIFVPWSHELHSSEFVTEVEDLYEPMNVPPVMHSERLDAEIPLYPASPMITPVPLAHTRSQIFKYAFGQIEKEKAREKMKPISMEDLIFSEGFREMLEGSKRLQIELAFVALSLTLRGSNKRILSHVTGKLSPGRVTAVMGPSGAGKTTFLNALAGKETNCQITGLVFINGRPGSIQAYKRIIGFVPQDDIVHGSLTVEENLWFSAKYRLPVEMPKQDRVLIVERIITTLGLGSIRSSLVGTVEKRGISGGQRKRVNLAMEMVIEPSLLILDEPTSGLDSTSSRLVIQALRREASMGVNVGVVLHQPSYGLFKMFDDVMLLAKGGYTVYLGSVDEVEGYFSGLGFDVPERVNPPDYFMDALEGIALPAQDSTFDAKLLPILWMCHKGYQIPPDLQSTVNEIGSLGTRLRRLDGEKTNTFMQEAWDEFRVHFIGSWENFKSSFSRVRNMSGRNTPGFVNQFLIIISRVSKQKFREAKHIAQDYLILLLAGACLGLLTTKKDTLSNQGSIFTIIAVSLLSMMSALRTFSSDQLQFWRESASGINRIAYFLAKDTVDYFNLLMKPLVYLSMFYFCSDPRSSFGSNYLITLALVYCTTGIAYILAIIMQPAPAQLFSVFIPIVATLLATTTRSAVVDSLARLSFSRWALEAYVIANAKRYTGVWLITRCGVLQEKGYKLYHQVFLFGVLMGYGLLARFVALVCLYMCHRKRQK